MARGKRDEEKGESQQGRPREQLCGRLQNALSSQGRVEVFGVLRKRVASPEQIAAQLGAEPRQVGYHVSVLQKFGLIELDHSAPGQGGDEHFYRPTA